MVKHLFQRRIPYTSQKKKKANKSQDGSNPPDKNAIKTYSAQNLMTATNSFEC